MKKHPAQIKIFHDLKVIASPINTMFTPVIIGLRMWA